MGDEVGSRQGEEFASVAVLGLNNLDTERLWQRLWGESRVGV